MSGVTWSGDRYGRRRDSASHTERMSVHDGLLWQGDRDYICIYNDVRTLYEYIQDGVYRLAEIIAGFSLGLDLSLVASVISGQFATAHEKLGRNRPTSGMKEEYLVKELFQEVIGDRGVVNTWRVFDVCLYGNVIHTNYIMPKFDVCIRTQSVFT